MDVEVCTLSGYEDVGRNMTAVRIDDEVIILDMGVSIQAISTYEREEGSTKILSSHQLMDIKAIPDDRKIDDWKNMVKAIVLGHGHYDHIAAVQFLAGKYKCPIIGSPYTLQVLKSILKDEDIKIPNKFMAVDLDDTIKISDNIKIELISMSHSTLQCAMVVVHTPKGIVLYANDFKFDNDPVLGEKPNYKRLNEIGKEGNLLVLIVECINGLVEGKTPSEKIARELLKEVLLETDTKGKAVFVTTFASNIARIKSAIEFGKKMGRKVVILGRSMFKFNEAAESLDLVNFSRDAEIIGYGGQRRRKLKEIDGNRGKYLVITTGSQGEPGSVLDKIVNKQLPFSFKEGDIVVFSCRTIPVPMNIANRDNLENALKLNKVRIFTNVHSSGHAGLEDIRDFITMVKPKNIIPSQGTRSMEDSVAKMAEGLGYKLGENIHLVSDGQRLKF
ncbi:RNase J family beta-CASP ribonuclease [Candidatus Woesearchaeota archaeon]|nr:RNase J family beta-CASP ribonuclease [Candidatus Woesearchaeota archaeon]